MSIHSVLHVATPAAPGAGASTLCLVGLTRRGLPEFDHQLLILGPASLSRMARSVGAGTHHRVPPLFNTPQLTARAIRRAIATIGADLIHAWDAESARIVIGGRPQEAVAVTLGAVPSTRGPTPLAQDRAEALCIGERARRQAIAAGWLHGRVRTVLPADPPSGGAFGVETMLSRTELRDSWGVDDSTVAVGVVGDPWSAIDAKLAFDMVGRTWLAGHRVRLVIDPRVVAAGELRRWANLTSLREVFVEDARVALPWVISAGLDAVLLPEALGARGSRSRWRRAPSGAPSGPLSALWCHRAGLPVVSTRGGPLDGLVESEALHQVDPRANAGAVALSALRVRDSADIAPLHRSERSSHWLDEVRSLYSRAASAAGVSRTMDMSPSAASR